MPRVTLSISRAENRPGQYLVVVSGEDFHASSGRKVAARIRGDDDLLDDKLFSIGTGAARRISQDGTFSLSQIVSGRVLNEDWGRDEIYALVDVEGVSRDFKSNKVTGSF